jgi:hypothetical protein
MRTRDFHSPHRAAVLAGAVSELPVDGEQPPAAREVREVADAVVDDQFVTAPAGDHGAHAQRCGVAAGRDSVRMDSIGRVVRSPLLRSTTCYGRRSVNRSGIDAKVAAASASGRSSPSTSGTTDHGGAQEKPVRR